VEGDNAMNSKNKISETYSKMLSENKFLSRGKLNESYEKFRLNFAPKKLLGLDGEVLLETMFNHGNKGSLVYWLEFKNDDEIQTARFGGIGGGSALKFGIYKRKEDGKWITGNPKDMREIGLTEAIKIARRKRDLLAKGAEFIAAMPQNANDVAYIKLQEDIDRELDGLGNLGWVHKYFHMLFPDKIDDFHSVEWQKFYLIKMQENPLKSDGRYALGGQFIQLAKLENMPINWYTQMLYEIYGPLHNYWRIGTTDDTKSYWNEMLKNGYVSIGWPKLGDICQFQDLNDAELRAQIKNLLSENYPNTPQMIGKLAFQIIAFYKNIKPNDVVVAVEGYKVLGIGKVIGEYEYKGEFLFPHCLNVKWIVGASEKLPKPAEGLMTAVNQYKDVNNLIKIEKNLGSSVAISMQDKEPLKQLDNLSGMIANIDSMLKRKKQIIIYGPPGTGKTYWAEKACLELASRRTFKKQFEDLNESEKESLLGNASNKGIVRLCCFHPSYGYEDFVEGIKPKVINNQTVFDLKDGIFKEICDEAKKYAEKNYYLIVDEINRGDISRIFGELITLIESGKRGKEMILPLSGKQFSVPENVYIVGTMNTADRSIALLDLALRRRFAFYELMPDYNILSGTTIENLPIGLWLSELNGRIVEYVGRDARNLQIGHAYFMEKGMPIKDFDKLRKVIQEDIIPLLEEYCYGEYNTIAKIIGSSFVNVEKQEINYELFETVNKSDLISALLEPNTEIATALSVQTNIIEEKKEMGLGELGGKQQL
jgi:GTPase subunit of restriction endonuclease